jgi:hypothetical protein
MREIRLSGSVRGVRRKPYPYRNSPTTAAQQRKFFCPWRHKRHQGVTDYRGMVLLSRQVCHRLWHTCRRYKPVGGEERTLLPDGRSNAQGGKTGARKWEPAGWQAPK